MSATTMAAAPPKKKNRKLGIGLIAISLYGAFLLVMAVVKEAGGMAAIMAGIYGNSTIISIATRTHELIPEAVFTHFDSNPEQVRWLWAVPITMLIVAGLILLFMAVVYWNYKQDLARVDMTPAERAEADKLAARAATTQEQRARLKIVKKVAGKMRKDIIAHLATSGFTYIYERHGINVKASKPEIKHILYTQDSIYFRLDKLPFRINYTDLMDVEVATNMSIAIGRECEIISDTQLGLFIRVDLRSGYHAIPKVFPWYDRESEFNALDKLPASNPYTFALGVGKNRHVHHVDFRDLPHLLVAGATDGGKSVFLNQVILTLLVNNPPSRLQMIMIDMKDGLELYPYRDIPHLIRPIIHEQEKVIEALQFAMKVKQERATLFRENGVRKIQDWNKTHHTTLPYILIVIDEIAAIMMNKELSGVMTDTMRVMAEQVRALGINIIICTQRPDKDALPGPIKTNIPKRVAFAMDNHGSRVVIGTEHASKLTSKTGRFWYKDGVRLRELQAPFISPKEIDETIARIVANELASPRLLAETAVVAANALPPVAPVVVDPIIQAFRLALENRVGGFSVKDVYGDMRNELTHKEVVAIASDYEFNFEDKGPVITVDGEDYILAPPVHSRASRKLIAIGDELPACVGDIYDS